jgi:broad specificity phosphatase PhoE
VHHGETIWNVVGIFQGQSESELNELGCRQANAVAERLVKEKHYCLKEQFMFEIICRIFSIASVDFKA